MNEIAIALLGARKEQGMTQDEVIEKCNDTHPDVGGIVRPALSFWEKGTRQPSIVQFMALVTALEMPDIRVLEVLRGTL